MKRYRAAAVLMIIHGGLMEAGTCLAFIPAVLSGSASGGAQYFSFIVPYLQENLTQMMAMGGIYGIVRVIGAIGLLKNRMWGLVLSVINCVITMALMIFMLPAGILDGILACTSLVLILTAYFGKKAIKE